MSTSAALVLFLVCGAVGVFAAETARKAWLWIAKPLTTLLLLAVVGLPNSRFKGLVFAGVVLSLVGDTALLFESERSFLFGLVAFLGAHLLYTLAFLSKAEPENIVALYALAMLLVTLWLLRRLWAGAGPMRIPVAIYGFAIATMVVAALSLLGGPALPPVASGLAAGGAVLFFVSDATLATGKFGRPIPHAALVTLGVYWLGQLGIALSARLGG